MKNNGITATADQLSIGWRFCMAAQSQEADRRQSESWTSL